MMMSRPIETDCMDISGGKPDTNDAIASDISGHKGV